ncbi:hypothetical protein BTO30_04035 [Domibacillus antri]|uniref:Uncharacterized protein n=1 Tax=Domibacillus antri TaxID=1714264 RepID=A0A1Q8Q739_9BACI|nr:hypothetical protein [Domibacillus antri]OLN23149.1 hypothetical protein BTO30_04035 [Domibacillus antri]
MLLEQMASLKGSVFFFQMVGFFLESLLFFLVLFILIGVVKEAKYAKKLQAAGTGMNMISLFWIFFGPYSFVSHAVSICVFFMGMIIMAIALIEEFVTERVRNREPLSEKKTKEFSR